MEPSYTIKTELTFHYNDGFTDLSFSEFMVLKRYIQHKWTEISKMWENLQPEKSRIIHIMTIPDIFNYPILFIDTVLTDKFPDYFSINVFSDRQKYMKRKNIEINFINSIRFKCSHLIDWSYDDIFNFTPYHPEAFRMVDFSNGKFLREEEGNIDQMWEKYKM
jgi:hypothetical protein